MPHIVDTYLQKPIDAAALDCSARLILGASANGLLRQITSDLFVAPDLLESMAGRAWVVAGLVPPNHIVTANTALWIYQRSHRLAPLVTLSPTASRTLEFHSLRTPNLGEVPKVNVYGLQIALPKRALEDLQRLG